MILLSLLQIGMWIGVALGLLVVLGLLVLGVYFYMKQRALQSTKPPPYSRDRDGSHVNFIRVFMALKQLSLRPALGI